MFKQLFSFNGRIGRLDYAISFILFCFYFAFFNAVIKHQGDELFDIVIILFYFPLLWIVLAKGAKRCHDVGLSGWCILIPLFCFALIFWKGKDPQSFK